MNYLPPTYEESINHHLFEINIKLMSSKTYRIYVTKYTTIREVKIQQFLKSNIPVNQIRYINNGIELYDDEKTLDFYGIKKDTSINMVLKLRGGMLMASSGRSNLKLLDINNFAPKSIEYHSLDYISPFGLFFKDQNYQLEECKKVWDSMDDIYKDSYYKRCVDNLLSKNE